MWTTTETTKPRRDRQPSRLDQPKSAAVDLFQGHTSHPRCCLPRHTWKLLQPKAMPRKSIGPARTRAALVLPIRSLQFSLSAHTTPRLRYNSIYPTQLHNLAFAGAPRPRTTCASCTSPPTAVPLLEREEGGQFPRSEKWLECPSHDIDKHVAGCIKGLVTEEEPDAATCYFAS